MTIVDRKQSMKIKTDESILPSYGPSKHLIAHQICEILIDDHRQRWQQLAQQHR